MYFNFVFSLVYRVINKYTVMPLYALYVKPRVGPEIQRSQKERQTIELSGTSLFVV